MKKKMISRLPVRRNIEPIFQIVNDLEKPSLTIDNEDDNDYCINLSDNQNINVIDKLGKMKKYSANFNGRSRSLERRQHKEHHRHPEHERAEKPFINDDTKNKNSQATVLKTRDEQVEKLIEKVAALHTCNNQLADENQKLNLDIGVLRQSINTMARSLDNFRNNECESCIEMRNNYVKIDEERQQYEKENKELRDDIKMMKILVYRLNVQLERHQEVLRKIRTSSTTELHTMDYIKIDFGECGTPQEQKAINWGGVTSHTLGPLLNAYEETIREKNDLIQQYEKDMNHFTGKLKEILVENDHLQEEMQKIKSGHDIFLTEKVRLQSQLDICRNKAELQSKRADLAKEKLIEVVRCYEQKIQSQTLDLDRLHDAYSRAKGELATFRVNSSQPQENPASVIDSLKECQKLFEELKLQHDKERVKLDDEVKQLRESLNTEEKKCIKLAEEINQLNELIRRQRDCNEVLNEKNCTMKNNLHRLRQARESLKQKLIKSYDYKEKINLKTLWTDVNNVEQIIKHKDAFIQKLEIKYLNEIEYLTRKLKQRDDILKKVLHTKTQVKK